MDNQEEPRYTFWADPYSDRIVLETTFCKIRFDDLAQIRDFAVEVLNEVNKLEYHRTKSKPGARKGRKIGKTYADRAILEWEQLLEAKSINDTSGGEDESTTN